MVIKAWVLFYSVIFRYDKRQLRHCEVTDVSRQEVTGPLWAYKPSTHTSLGLRLQEKKSLQRTEERHKYTVIS